MFKKKVREFPEKLARRVRRIPTNELHMWADNALTDIGRCLSSYERSGERVFLDEALNGAEAMHAVVAELHKRSVI